MCPRLSEDWRADGNRKRRIHIFGPLASSVAIALLALAMGLFCALFLVLLFGWGGAGAWAIIGIMLASIGFAVAVSAAIDRLARRRRSRRVGGRARPTR
jgi:hypothetical protein